MAKMTYVATHDETGEMIQGTVEEVAELLGVNQNRIYRAAATAGQKVGWHWDVEKKNHFTPDLENKWPMELSAEWERVTRPFKKASRRAGGQNA